MVGAGEAAMAVEDILPDMEGAVAFRVVNGGHGTEGVAVQIGGGVTGGHTTIILAIISGPLGFLLAVHMMEKSAMPIASKISMRVIQQFLPGRMIHPIGRILGRI